MESRSPIFVLAMPRCRTAWLSLCLSSLGVNCSHEGMRDSPTFEAYASELESRLAKGPAGDADPALVCWLDDLLKRWPSARFVVICRDAHDSRDALVNASPDQQAKIAENWPLYVQSFLGACDRLREHQGSTTRLLGVQQLADNETLIGLMEEITGKRPSLLWAQRMQRLQTTALIEPLEAPAPRVPPPIDVMSGIDLINVEGLQAREYTHADFPMVNEWWEKRIGSPLKQTMLPPLGVIVTHDGEPWAAIWCYEIYGAPVAELTFPVTRPGLSVADAARALSFGVLGCMHAAGKAHVPEARFNVFKVVAPEPMVRFLKRLGFKEYLTKRVPMLVTL